jgi:hypothetical protein
MGPSAGASTAAKSADSVTESDDKKLEPPLKTLVKIGD